MTNNLALNGQQRQAFDLFLKFLHHKGMAVFILKGYAGTGKTTLLQQLAQYLEDKKEKFSLLAPTGRAASVLSTKSGLRATTIHSELYHFSDLEGDADPTKVETEIDDFGQMRLLFSIRSIDEKSDKVYLVDEASMIGDERNDQTSFASFGTGHLLTDLLTLAGNNKLIFAGDPCQLPPVGSFNSPALTTDFFANLGIKVFEFELTEILRQKQGSEILKLATQVRHLVKQPAKSKWIKLPAQKYSSIHKNSFQSAKELYLEEIKKNGTEQSIAISLSNKNCHQINLMARETIFGKDQNLMLPKDLLMVTQNNYLVPLTNGEFVKVIKVGDHQFHKGLSFRHITVMSLLTGVMHHALLCEEPLYNGTNNLTWAQQRSLMVDFSQRMRKKGIKPKTPQYYEKMLKDPFINSLKANFGYAVTCHKSQGGEWKNVFFFLNKGMYAMNPPELARWWYTGITRAKENLYLVDDWWIS